MDRLLGRRSGSPTKGEAVRYERAGATRGPTLAMGAGRTSVKVSGESYRQDALRPRDGGQLSA